MLLERRQDITAIWWFAFLEGALSVQGVALVKQRFIGIYRKKKLVRDEANIALKLNKTISYIAPAGSYFHREKIKRFEARMQKSGSVVWK